jgi:predicted transcriptional regulator
MLKVIAHNQEDALRKFHTTQHVTGQDLEHINELIRCGLVQKTAKRKDKYKLTTRGKEVLKYLNELDEKTDRSWTTSLSTVREMNEFCVCVTHQKKF